VTPESIFAVDAYAAVFEATDGVPRLVNQLCDRALVDANAAGRSQIDRQVIQTSWADIQQLPAPWETPDQSTLTPASRVIEFGSLANDDRSFDQGVKAESAARIAEFDTELDEIDDADEFVIASPAVVATPTPTKPQKVTDNPFAEKFDEEEVVLDNFAAWDDMFRRDTPRVVNRRDPEFATLVEAAIQATASTNFLPNFEAPELTFAFDLQNIFDAVEEVEAAPEETSQQEADMTWPPLRIADVSDAPVARPVPMPSKNDEPVLIIEDDAPVPAPHKPPVRREEYRNLFSRLRSG
jgi:hypothetical protein